jgi:anion-transporting  ArsA/GET3 family ATPase
MRIRIFVGTGGVGKTSVAAASALQAALIGGKCLVLTIDPALRLRKALGLTSQGIEQRVDLDSLAARGELWAGLMDVHSTLDRAVRLYGTAKQAETVLGHPIYRMLVDSLAGMQELLAIERIDQAMAEGFEDIFIDTAPSRHAFEFLDKPEFFAQLVSLPLIQWVGKTYRWWEGSALSRLGRKSVELYSRVEEILGATLVRQVLDFYAVFRTIAEGYADRARRTSSLLHRQDTTSFTIVTSPNKAQRDGDYLLSELKKRDYSVDRLVVNRVWPELDLEPPTDAPRIASEMMEWYREVSGAHARTCGAVMQHFSGRVSEVRVLDELSRDVDGLAALKLIADRL